MSESFKIYWVRIESFRLKKSVIVFKLCETSFLFAFLLSEFLISDPGRVVIKV